MKICITVVVNTAGVLTSKKGNKMCEEKPYLFEDKVVQVRKYNINYGDHRICQCGHSYYDHFIQPDLIPMGCELCGCIIFMEKEEHDTK
jgi:hypothetical protein